MKGSRRIKRRLGIGGLGWLVDKPNGWGQQRLRTKRNEAVLGNIKGPPMAKVEDVCGALGVKTTPGGWAGTDCWGPLSIMEISLIFILSPKANH